MERILVSACLLGVSCRYDGDTKPLSNIEKLLEKYEVIPVCAEIFGGLPTPRVPAEVIGDKVITRDGRDVTAEYLRGANEVLRLGKLFGCKKALLKERSPSCGRGIIYSGKFDNTFKEGNGKTAQLLLANGFEIYGESEIDKLL